MRSSVLKRKAKREGVAVFVPSSRGLPAARKIESGLNAVVFGPDRLKEGGLLKEVKRAFGSFSALVFICASGIAVRAVGPLLKGKERDPAVVVVDEPARFAVSLVSGHLGGANGLARRLSVLLGATPVITTATDSFGLPCAEEMAASIGALIENARGIKRVNSAILDKKRVAVIDADPGRLAALKRLYGGIGLFAFRRTPPAASSRYGAAVLVTPHVSVPEPLEGALILRPADVVAGIGCGRGVGASEIEDAFEAFLREADLSPLSVRGIATIDIKRDEAGLNAFARRMGLKVDYFDAAALKKRVSRREGSAFVESITGSGGVSEPAAVISAGARRIWFRKKRYGRVTIAAARVPFQS